MTYRDILQRRRRAYRDVFELDLTGAPTHKTAIVLGDLSRFCRSKTSTAQFDKHGAIDPIAMAIAEGRREVFNRIIQYIYLEERQIQLLTEDRGE